MVLKEQANIFADDKNPGEGNYKYLQQMQQEFHLELLLWYIWTNMNKLLTGQM